MSKVEAAFCRSAPWRAFAERAVLPWALDRRVIEGEVLEIGGGSGAMAQALLASQPGVTRLSVVDVDPGMIRSARGRLGSHGSRAAVEVADVTELPFPDGAFDVVLSFLMLHHVIDWKPCLDEVRRVLRPGGLFLGYDLTANAVTDGFHAVDRSPVVMLRPAQLEDGLVTAGFGTARVRRTPIGGLMRFRAQV